MYKELTMFDVQGGFHFLRFCGNNWMTTCHNCLSNNWQNGHHKSSAVLPVLTIKFCPIDVRKRWVILPVIAVGVWDGLVV